MIIVDVETTGRDPKKNCIISIGAISYETKQMFYQECRPAPYAQIDPCALEVNGFTPSDCIDPLRLSFNVVMQRFADWLLKQPERTIGGANVGTFDIPMIDAGMKYCGIEIKLGGRVHDLHSICASHMMRRGLQLPQRAGRTDLCTDDIFEYAGLPQEPLPHNALTGAKMEAETFARINEGKNLLREYESYPIPPYLWTPQ